MRTKWKALVLLWLVAVSIAFAPLRAEADFGDFSGDYDYGGYDSYDSYDSYGYDDDDYDYGGSSYYGDGGGSGGSGGSGISSGELLGLAGGNTLRILVLMLVFFAVLRLLRRALGGHAKHGKQKVTHLPPGASRTSGLLPMDEIYKWDAKFSAEAIRQRLSKLYVQMQNCWTDMDITPLRGDFTDEQFAQYDRQLAQYRGTGIINKIERITVLDVELKGVRRDDVHDVLVAELLTRITTYTIKESTGEVVRGNPNEEKFMRYEWTLVRPRDTQTAAVDVEGVMNCPNCGAPVHINQSAQCPYCAAILTRREFDWVIAQIKGLSQQTM